MERRGPRLPMLTAVHMCICWQAGGEEAKETYLASDDKTSESTSLMTQTHNAKKNSSKQS